MGADAEGKHELADELLLDPACLQDRALHDELEERCLLQCEATPEDSRARTELINCIDHGSCGGLLYCLDTWAETDYSDEPGPTPGISPSCDAFCTRAILCGAEEEQEDEARELTRTFGSFTAVDHITFDVARGEVFGFLGANGAGKTTAIRMLTGLLAPSEGGARVAGHDVASEAEAVKRRIGYMSQRFALYDDLTVRENAALYGGIYGLSTRRIKERTRGRLERLGLQHAADERVARLPLGWKQKLAFSVAMLHEPEVVFLDEPTSGVDPITRRQFWEMIYEAAQDGTTVLVTTHYMDEAEYCDRVSIMVDGRIEAMGTPARLKDGRGASSIDEVFVQLARPQAKQGRAPS